MVNVDQYLVGGWTLPPSEKYDSISWDDEIPYAKIENIPNHEPNNVIYGHYNEAVIMIYIGHLENVF